MSNPAPPPAQPPPPDPPGPGQGQPRRRRPRPHNRPNNPPTTGGTNETEGHAPPNAGVELPPFSSYQHPPSAPANASGQRGARRGLRGRADHPAPAPSSSTPQDPAGLTAALSGVHISGPAEGTREDDAPRRRRRRPRKHEAANGGPEAQGQSAGHSASSSIAGDPDETIHGTSSSSNLPPARTDRRRKFGSTLTAPSSSDPSHSTSASATGRAHPAPPPPPESADLLTRLTHSLSHQPYFDCPICFSPLHPAQPVWSCVPSPSISANCWTPFHLRCIREWAAKSVKETREAWLARGEERQGEWRCPGCQTRRTEVPREYRCFCGRVAQPSAGRMATPHSCGEKCARRREKCEHPCPLMCHPGPCPSCVVTVQRGCYCGKRVLALRCSHLTGTAGRGAELSCGDVCGKRLGCGKHACERECHPGECAPCLLRETVRCYCGKEAREVACGEGEAKSCFDPLTNERWEGRYACAQLCGRLFACGVHVCEAPCHPPPLEPELCPTDPQVIKTCPCTQTALLELKNGKREKCTDPIPTCGKTCGKPLEGCDHLCAQLCHVGPCEPCAVPLQLSCRCGETVRPVLCAQATSATNATSEILCDRPCRALRHCGRHVCARVCCPLAWQGKVAKGKRKALETALLGHPEDDPEGWHECDLVCGKLLNCRIHHCTLPDHRGTCPRCLQSSFEELSCYCGRTVLMPPIPCGTVVDCPFPCSRPEPACGHPKTQHTCHEEGECPPCPFLTTKRCACGKVLVPNVRCSQEKVGCGTVCGKLLDCGFHSCEKLCHAGECESCTQVCGKPRKLCAHPCAVQCHAPSACPELEPCPARVTITCACGRIKQQALCGACTSSPSSRASTQLKCGQECAIAKRNARLAEALGIPEGSKSKLTATEWPDRLVQFYRENREWASVAEKNMNDFVQSAKKTQVLPQMVQARQRFMHELANVYRMDVDYVDSGANRSVQLVRRVDSRIPSPMLSEVAGPAVVTQTRQPGSGLVSLNRPKAPAAPARGAWGAPAPKPASAAAALTAPAPATAPVLSSWDTPITRPAATTSATVSRTITPAATVSHAPAVALAQPDEPVRDSWEDD